MERHIALDVHAESTTCAVVGPSGKRLSLKVVETSGPALLELMRSIASPRPLVLEEGTHSEWLHELLAPLVEELVVAIPERMEGQKSDAHDAWALAEKLRCNAVKRQVFKRPHQFQQLRAAVRAHRLLTKDTVRAKNRLRAIFRSRAISVSEEVYRSEGRKKVLALLPPGPRYLAEVLGAELEVLEGLRAETEKQLQTEAKQHPAVRWVATVPGIGWIRAATIVAVVVAPERFRTSRQFWSYSGLGIVMRTSADWVQRNAQWVRAEVSRTRGLNRNRNPWLKEVFKGAARRGGTQT